MSNKRIENVTVTSGSSLELFGASVNEQIVNEFQKYDEHQIKITGAGTPTVEYKLAGESSYTALVSDTGVWTIPKTVWMSNIINWKFTAAGGDIVVSLDSKRASDY